MVLTSYKYKQEVKKHFYAKMPSLKSIAIFLLFISLIISIMGLVG